ncbi:MAG: PQQ-binding-like beta-propeller repeat protein [Proteobacteria bacterium]|nr:PQQ-binding-like beta-propeller repeat protein [Pseudomonadota bacterium]
MPPTNTDWSTYLGDNARRHYTTLDQITRENVATLKLAWKYDSGELRGSRSTMYTSPLVVDGVLYGLSPKLVAFALDAASGTELWRYDPDLPQAQRGLMWWRRGEDRRLLYTAGSQLLALNADDGTPVETFGEQGRVDLTPKVPGAYIGVTVPGVVFEDLIIVGFATNEDASAYPGSVRAFDAVDGSLVWQFDTIPAPGAPGSQTWAEGSLEKAGGANVWSGMALDEARGILFAPTGSATPDFYGADRLGDNLFANCLLAINARTGELIWHYQIVRHDLWDRDNPSPPTLVQLERDGRLIDAVALTTKSGHLYVFDRVTGESIYPITEVTTLPSTMPGEVAALSQPVSAVAFSRQQFEITDRSEEAAEHVSKQIEGFDLRPWAPPQVGGLIIHPWYDGGAEWGGSAFDPSTRRLILNAQDVSGVLEMFTVPVGSSPQGSYMRHCGSCHGQDMTGTDTGPELTGVADRIGYEKVIEVVNNGSGRMPGFAQLDEVERRGALRYILSPVPPEGPPTTKVTYAHGGYSYLRDHDGLPGNTPPWGTLNSIDLATGESRWQVPFGNYPAHPDLGLGAISYGGPVVTASGLIFIAATPDRKIRAYNSDNAEILWEAELSAAGFSTPAIYSVAGKQYVVIAAGGGRTGPPSGAEYFAFSLP